MIQIDGSNFKNFHPEDLAQGLADGKFQLIETGVQVLGEIISHISQALGQRSRLRKRVEVLEETVRQQQLLLTKILEGK